jgi:hypothetical protein
MERFQDLVGRGVKRRFKVLPLVGAYVSTNAQSDCGGGTHQRDKDYDPRACYGLALATGQPFPLVFQFIFGLAQRRDGMVVTVGRSLQIGSHDGQEYLGITKLMEDDSPSIRWLILFFTNLDAERQIYKRVVTWRVIAEQVFMSE